MEKIAITGGGTGGHLKIAKMLKDELNERGIKPIFIGSTNGQDRAWFENDNGFSKKYFLNSRGVFGKNIFDKIFSLLNILLLSVKTVFLLKKEKIDKVFLVGGYSGAPASIASLLLKKKLFIH